MKIRTIIFLNLFLFSVLPLTLFGCLIINNFNNKMEDILTEELDSVSKVQMVAVDTFIESRREVLTILADFNYIKDAINKNINNELDDDTRNYIDDMLISRKNIKSFVNSLTIVDKNYEIVASSGDYEGKNAGKLEQVNHDYLQGDFRIGNIYTKESSDVKLLACYKGVYDNNELIGFVIEELLVDHFKQFTNKNIFAEETVYIVDGFNDIISMTDEAKHNKHILDEHFRDQDSGNCLYEQDGSKYITYYSKINYTDWYTIASTNLSARYSTYNQYRMLLYFILLILVAVILTAIVFVAKQISSPINKIVTVLNKVTTTDDYSVRINSNSKNEIGKISNEVDLLLSYLEEVYLKEEEKIDSLKQEAAIDHETGTFNKHTIEGVIQNVLDGSDKVVVGFLDIDSFKEFNTKYGHVIGDEVIKYVAKSIIEVIKGPVGRVGGDEFVFCFNSPTEVKEVKKLMETLKKKINAGIMVDKQILKVNCSIGLLIAKGENLQFDDVVSKADKAMYMAKAKGKNTYFVVESNE